MVTSTYSFLDVNATINGPGGNFNLAAGAGAAEEGITMVIGADGSGQHNLIANDASKVTIRLLKTSPINNLLMSMYNFQALFSANWGQNNITITNAASGDYIDLAQAAFTKRPQLSFAKEGGLNEWQFDAIVSTIILGNGQVN
jgi:hypothetical protein